MIEIDSEIDYLDILLPIIRSKSRELESLLSENNRFIWAEPCGGYKTLATAAFISVKWSKGILYTAERKESLNKMKDLLVKFRVPEEVIGVYYCSSDGLNEDRRLDWKSWIVTTNPKTVALATHQRLKIEPSTWWMNTAEQ
jgi:hypothetical protein